MSSVPSTSFSKTIKGKPVSNSLQLFRIRPVLSAVKRLLRKMKKVHLFRRRMSSYIPFEEWEAFHKMHEMGDLVSNMGSFDEVCTADLDYLFIRVEEYPSEDFLAEEETQHINEPDVRRPTRIRDIDDEMFL